MPIVYHRNNYNRESLQETTDHVVAHISSVASVTDDPAEFADFVNISYTENEDGSTRVYGELQQEPACDYTLPDDYVKPSEDQYQQGFGERNMTPEELQEHLLKKAGLK
ncbi:hypothetical protein TIN4_28 [Tsukamurella phage TIN4]|uniref:Uncharacterized protein n=2 Tax=Tinduovirus TIN3 TaxID=1982571 RepID=A0A0K0N5Z4_9CAUD|nr:hypothetical protein AVT54_gp097 [Tsukamurella phage TIN3]YP_009604158.1 hypothetical protein FDH87_gp097 [Tsukamurella phage TIN4]AKJ71825.1 hypothetical protein TIN3_28 [Tsukamurella phage TIN3]AKJ71934.1 hypothetical protein TIN4_28 [Tsukamurella phage TIN4]